MDGPHDLGGAHGLGPINPEPESEEPIFHADWERTAMALTIATGTLGQWNIDMGRHARESQHPVNYLSNTYYENWLTGLERLLLDKGLVTAEELATGQATQAASPQLQARALKGDDARQMLSNGRSAECDTDAPAQFQVGASVRVTVKHSSGHTRSPRYVRGRIGVVHEHYGAHVFPDAHAHGNEIGVHLYSVRFEADELWGDDRSGDAVYVDLWERYLETP